MKKNFYRIIGRKRYLALWESSIIVQRTAFLKQKIRNRHERYIFPEIRENPRSRKAIAHRLSSLTSSFSAWARQTPDSTASRPDRLCPCWILRYHGRCLYHCNREKWNLDIDRRCETFKYQNIRALGDISDLIRFSFSKEWHEMKMILLIVLIILQGILSTCGDKICARTTTGSSTVSWWTESESPGVDIDVGRSADRKPCWDWIDTGLFLLKISCYYM